MAKKISHHRQEGTNKSIILKTGALLGEAFRPPSPSLPGGAGPGNGPAADARRPLPLEAPGGPPARPQGLGAVAAPQPVSPPGVGRKSDGGWEGGATRGPTPLVGPQPVTMEIFCHGSRCWPIFPVSWGVSWLPDVFAAFALGLQKQNLLARDVTILGLSTRPELRQRSPTVPQLLW